MRRLLCRLFGHQIVTWMLPEEDFGLYAFSRIGCSRCPFVVTERTPEEIVAAFHYWERTRPLPDPIDVDYPCVACGVRADACCGSTDPTCRCCIGCNHPYSVTTYPEPVSAAIGH